MFKQGIKLPVVFREQLW